jgi:hypothetical protein
MHIILAFQKLRQEDHEFEANLGHTAILYLKTKTKTKTKKTKQICKCPAQNNGEERRKKNSMGWAGGVAQAVRAPG